MSSVLKKIITSHRFSLIILLFIQWSSFLVHSQFPARLNTLIFMSASVGLGIALLGIYFNKAVGINEKGQQQGVKVRRLITLLGCTAIVFMVYLLYRRYAQAAIPGRFWLAIISWTIAFILLMIRSRKYNSAVYHLLTILSGTGTMLLLSAGATPLNAILPDSTGILLAACYILLVLSFNIDKPVIRSIIMGVCLLATGLHALFWLAPVIMILWLNEPKRSFYSMIVILAIAIAGICILSYSGIQWSHLLNSAGTSAAVSIPFGLAMLSAMAILYLRVRKVIHYKIFLMGSFKISLAVFMFLPTVPYAGLMLTDLFVSIAIYSEVGKYHFAGEIQKGPAGKLIA